MSGWKAWEYEGYYFDDDISMYIPVDKGFPACTLRFMATRKKHLRVEKYELKKELGL